MAEISVSYFLSLINEQIRKQEIIEECLDKLEALTIIAQFSEDFFESNNIFTLQNYMGVLNDLIYKASDANQASLISLLKQLPKKSV